MDAASPMSPLHRLLCVLGEVGPRVVACSGGVDSLLLSYLAHRADPEHTIVAHSVTPAVPPAATSRVLAGAHVYGWNLRLVTSQEFSDPRYLSNPRNRCYFCKTHLYEELKSLLSTAGAESSVTVSGANVDDLGEYRPGLRAAEEHGVRHPYVEAGLGKSAVRAIAAAHGLDWADLPASPCLASRLYTGTSVTPLRLRAVDVGEETLRGQTGIRVARTRIRDDDVLVEVEDADRSHVTGSVLERVSAAMRAIDPTLNVARLDADAYRPGRSFLPVA